MKVLVAIVLVILFFIMNRYLVRKIDTFLSMKSPLYTKVHGHLKDMETYKNPRRCWNKILNNL
jgi:hypothetical protein